MADEAVLVEGEGGVQDFTVNDSVTIEKFTLCKLADPRTASATSGTGDIFAGIAATEKNSTDNASELGLWTEGIFKLTNVAGPSITAGAMVVTSGANLIRTAVAAELLTGAIIGKALETMASNTQGEVRLKG